MELNKKTYLRRHLEQMSTAKLEEQLQIELHAEEPEEELVRTILQILEERDQQDPSNIQIDGTPVWEKYKLGLTERKDQQKKHKRRGIQALAATAAVLALVIIVLPQAANANNIVELMARWSDSFFAFFNPAEIEPEEYVFKTDNPGLQQVYDSVVEMGITDPVVPMWLEDGYKLKELKKSTSPTKERLHAVFAHEDKQIALTISLCYSESSYRTHKDEIEPQKYDFNGMSHYISRNVDIYTVTWTQANIICTLCIDCQEETLHKVLKSIYIAGVNK